MTTAVASERGAKRVSDAWFSEATVWFAGCHTGEVEIGHGGGERVQIWRIHEALTDMKASLPDGTYTIVGATGMEWADESGTTLETWPVSMTITGRVG